MANSKYHDLEERCLNFAKNTNNYVKNLPKTTANYEYSKQLIRSSGSVGANYLEANESLGRKDFLMRIRIAKKEARESRYWLELTEPSNGYGKSRQLLINETIELMKIFGAIVEKSK